MTGAELIAEERIRQIGVEGFNEEHDNNHANNELVSAAITYLKTAVLVNRGNKLSTASAIAFDTWPWEALWFKPMGPIPDLIRAGALIAAEIDRLQRLGTNE